MSVLSDLSIRAYLDAGRISISPLFPEAIQPASYDVHLGRVLKILEPGHRVRLHDLIDDGPFALYRGVFLLAHTLETLTLPDDLIAILAGKSSLAREGLRVEDAGYVDCGWRGELTCEVDNRAPDPISLVLGMPFAQLRFHRMTTSAERPYGSPGVGHYQGSVGPVESRHGREVLA